MNNTQILSQLYMFSPIYFINENGDCSDLNLEISEKNITLSYVDDIFYNYISDCKIIKNDKKILDVSDIDILNKIQIKFIQKEYTCLPFIVPKFYFVAEIIENDNPDISSTFKLITYSICKAGVYSKSFIECDTFYSKI